MRSSPKVPLVTVGGFLGSGKTTMINNLLAQAAGRKMIVFVNDFGEINIDYDLIQTVEEDRIALTNGCICCSIREDLVRSISRAIRETDDIDVAIVEASGVSDPIGLSSSLRRLEDADLVRSELLIYIVDALSFPSLDFDEREQVIDFAIQSDLVVLNKCDIAPRAQIDRLKGLLTDASTKCYTIESRGACASLDFLLGFDRKHARHHPLAWHVSAAYHGFETWSGSAMSAVERVAFLEFAQYISRTCWRAKGLVCFAEAPDSVFVFNLVADRATLEPLSRNVALERKGGLSLVAIGRSGRIDREALQSAFRKMTGDGGSADR